MRHRKLFALSRGDAQTGLLEARIDPSVAQIATFANQPESIVYDAMKHA